METNTNSDLLIAKKLSGQLTPSEEADFGQFMASSAAFASDYEAMARIWNVSRSLCPASRIAARRTAEWHRLSQSLGAGRRRRPIVRTLRIALRVAAVLIPLAVLGCFIVYTRPAGSGWQTFATADNVDSIRLPDNTMVYLNRNTTIQYQMTAAKRQVRLSGIANFEVSHQKDCPFMVDAGMATVRVLGTSFMVENVEGRGRVDVQVRSGRVSFESNEGGCVQLTAGEHATFSNSVITRSDQIWTDEWQSGIIKLQSATLPEALDHLMTYYPEIESVNVFAQADTISVTTQFDSQPLSAVLDELSMHYCKKLLFSDGQLIVSDK